MVAGTIVLSGLSLLNLGGPVVALLMSASARSSSFFFIEDSVSSLSSALILFCLSVSAPLLGSRLEGEMAKSLSLVLLGGFSAGSAFWLYVMMEASLVPMVLMVLGSGPQPERVSGGVALWVYTLFASVPLLLGILNLSAKGWVCSGSAGVWSHLAYLMASVKGPMYGAHMWLPLAHVEASTVGSVFLAGVLLKLSLLLLVRLGSLGVLKTAKGWSVLALSGSGLSGVLALLQSDSKKAVAYSSVCHMAGGLAILIGSGGAGRSVALLLLLGHGVVSPLMFVGAASLGEAKGSRSSLIQSGWHLGWSAMGVWAFVLALNVSLPPFISFMSELGVFVSLAGPQPALSPLLWLGMGASLALSLSLFVSSSHGSRSPCVKPPLSPLLLFGPAAGPWVLFSMLSYRSKLWSLGCPTVLE